MDMDLTDYGLRAIMDHDLDYDNVVFSPSPPHPAESAGSSPLPTGRPRSSSTPLPLSTVRPGSYKSYSAAYKLEVNTTNILHYTARGRECFPHTRE